MRKRPFRPIYGSVRQSVMIDLGTCRTIEDTSTVFLVVDIIILCPPDNDILLYTFSLNHTVIAYMAIEGDKVLVCVISILEKESDDFLFLF